MDFIFIISPLRIINNIEIPGIIIKGKIKLRREKYYLSTVNCRR